MTDETKETKEGGIKVPNITYRVVKYSDWAKLKRQLIPLEAVADYGWDANIIAAMLRYEILPNRYVWSGKVYLRRDDVIQVNNRMITNEVNRYKMFADYRKRQAEIQAELDKPLPDAPAEIEEIDHE